jgi:hypothetical protein
MSRSNIPLVATLDTYDKKLFPIIFLPRLKQKLTSMHMAVNNFRLWMTQLEEANSGGIWIHFKIIEDLILSKSAVSRIFIQLFLRFRVEKQCTLFKAATISILGHILQKLTKKLACTFLVHHKR